MTFCDLLTFLCPLPWYMFAYTFDNHASMTWTTYSCFLFEISIETLPQLFHTASIWLTLFLALQRYLYICKVAMAKQICTTGLTIKIIFAIIAISILHFLPMIFDGGYNILEGNKCENLMGNFLTEAGLGIPPPPPQKVANRICLYSCSMLARGKQKHIMRFEIWYFFLEIGLRSSGLTQSQE